MFEEFLKVDLGECIGISPHSEVLPFKKELFFF